jgi:hypothetical protein
MFINFFRTIWEIGGQMSWDRYLTEPLIKSWKKTKNKCQIWLQRAETGIILIIFNDVLYHIHIYIVFISFTWAGTRKTTPDLSGIRTLTLVVICTDYIGSCKPNYHTFTTMLAPIMRSEQVPEKLLIGPWLNNTKVYLTS